MDDHASETAPIRPKEGMDVLQEVLDRGLPRYDVQVGSGPAGVAGASPRAAA